MTGSLEALIWLPKSPSQGLLSTPIRIQRQSSLEITKAFISRSQGQGTSTQGQPHHPQEEGNRP